MKTKYTLEVANHLIPFINAVAGEVRERRIERDGLTSTIEELETTASRTSPEGFHIAVADFALRIRELDRSMDECRKELEKLGLSVQRMDPLTVHIPGSTRSGELVFCWEEGEPQIQHGHESGEEDNPRRPLKTKAT